MYKEYKQLNLSQIGKEVLESWKSNHIFEKSINNRPASKPYTFYEGPPSANGMPGIHHVMARSIKDIFCRYKTLKGFQVKRKGGWDTHGLPIELAVEKSLGITKEDIGKKISVEEYNDACRKEVMKYTDVWNDLTEKMGYWVDLENPYITYENEYIESLWWILKQLHSKGFLYKGYTVQPYSPAAGTGLSSHELNQPGTYRDVKDTSIVAQFRLKKDQVHPLISKLFETEEEDTSIIAWTTTPWTLPSNCALAVGEKITYVKIKTFNPYTHLPVSVVLAKDLIAKHFKAEAQNLSFQGQAWFAQQWDQLLERAERHHPYVSPHGAPRGRQGRHKQSKAHNLLRRLRQYRDDVWRFMTDAGVPFTNNLAEQALRMSKVRQKISGCFRTQEGADTFFTIRSYLATMHKQSACLFECLVSTFKGQPVQPCLAV